MDSTAAGEHCETLHDRVFKRGDWGRETPWLTFMGALRPLSLASGWVWAPDLREQIKTTYDFYYGALGFDTAHTSACTHQPLWGRFSPKPPSTRRRMEPPRLDVALRETGQDGLHRNTMGWLSMRSVCWGQLPAWGVKCHLPAALTPSDRSNYYRHQSLSLAQVAEVNVWNWVAFSLPVTQDRVDKMVLNDGIPGVFLLKLFSFLFMNEISWSNWC